MTKLYLLTDNSSYAKGVANSLSHEEFHIHKHDYEENKMPIINKDALIDKKVFVAMDQSFINYSRQVIFNLFRNHKAQFINVIHPCAIIDHDVELGVNIFIDSNVSIGAGSMIADNSVILSGTTIMKKCKIGKNTFIDESCTINSDLEIGNNAYLGKNTHALSGNIGENTTIEKQNMTVYQDVPKGTLFVENIAEPIHYINNRD